MPEKPRLDGGVACLPRAGEHSPAHFESTFRQKLAISAGGELSGLWPSLAEQAAKVLEASLHGMYRESRLHGEWFRLSPEQIEQFKQVKGDLL